MRAVAVMLCFAAAFGAAAIWQAQHIRELHARRDLAARVQDGEVASGPSGLIEAGWANVIVGRPSGVEPLDPFPAAAGQKRADEAPTVTPEPIEQPPAIEPVVPNDFELVVESGQTLSEIARAHYGTAAQELVKALAKYNGLADANAVRVGQKLRLPTRETLQR